MKWTINPVNQTAVTVSRSYIDRWLGQLRRRRGALIVINQPTAAVHHHAHGRVRNTSRSKRIGARWNLP